MSFRIFADTPRVSAAHEISFHAPATQTASSRRYFSDKLVYASAGHTDAPQAALNSGSAKLNATQAPERPQRPYIEDGGTAGGVNWSALFKGWLGHAASKTTGSGRSWREEGLSFRQSEAPQAVAEAALDASDVYPLVAGVGAAPLTSGLSLLAGGVAWFLLARAKKTARKQIGLPTTRPANFSKVTLNPVHKKIEGIRNDIESYQGGINEAVVENLGIVFEALDRNTHLLDKDDVDKLRQLKASAKNNSVTVEQAEKIYRRSHWAQLFQEVASPEIRVAIKDSNYRIDETRKEVARLQQQLTALQDDSRAIK